MGTKKIIIYVLAITVSILPDIFVLTLLKSHYVWVLPLKILTLSLLYLFSLKQKDRKPILDFLLVCVVMTITQAFCDVLKTYSFWKNTFPSISFITNLSGSMVMKAISVVGVLIVLFNRLKDRNSFFLVKGNLNVKADAIKWLGIEGDRVSWGKLALISGILISTGTFIATILTVTGFKMPPSMGNYIKIFPIILVFAFLNSLFEGIIYRNGILGTLSRLLPKDEAVLLAAFIFGIGHYYGAPGGIIGALMSTALGWYMGRSVIETKGMAAAWLIHFMQDVVIFSAFFLFAFK